MLFHIAKADGSDAQTVEASSAATALDGYPDFVIIAEVARRAMHDEELDPVSGQWVRDELAAADREAGREHIRAMHSLKQAEAVLYLSLAPGATIAHGIIAEEAAALNIDPVELAQSILDAAAEERAAEVARRERKEAHRGGGG